ncbi:MAG TPA: arginine deiminase-related protein [Caulifigura sp.]|nr:arginine deiminase-related protein [Caulifigura sp.]
MPILNQPTILMCPPDYYGIEYEINPWMSRSHAADVETARKQWAGLKSLLESLGADIQLLNPVPHLPDLVFTANAGLVYRNTVYLSRFRYPERQRETPVDAAWFQANGFQPREVTPGDFEGAGDALFVGETLVAGYLVRSDAAVHQWLGAQLACPVLPVQLVNTRYYHLDTCFCPLNATTAIWYPPAFDEYGQKAIRACVPRLIEVNEAEAARFACNAVVIGNHVALNSGCPELESQLEKIGYTAHATPLDEFIKAGGSAKCLTLRLDGEDAAAWRQKSGPA